MCSDDVKATHLYKLFPESGKLTSSKPSRSKSPLVKSPLLLLYGWIMRLLALDKSMHTPATDKNPAFFSVEVAQSKSLKKYSVAIDVCVKFYFSQ